MILTAGEWVMSLLQPATARIARRRRIAFVAVVALPLVVFSAVLAFHMRRLQSRTRMATSAVRR